MAERLNSSSPLVSILINNYNYGNFVGKAIESALNQTYRHTEVIVVDDGSTDNSREVIAQYGDRITTFFKENGGQASAFNEGFKASQGEIICFLDADDQFLPQKADRLVQVFQDNPQSNWCFHPLNFVKISAPIQSKKLSTDDIPNDYSRQYDLRDSIKKGKLSGRLPFEGAATSGIAFRRLFLEKILPMPTEIRITSDDYIKYIALGISEGFILSEPLANQIIHDDNAYTFRTDKQNLKAKIQIQTALWMRKNFPELANFSNSIFVAGKSIKIEQKDGSKTSKADINRLDNEYMKMTNFLEKIGINVRLLYHSLWNRW
ncbi:MAG: glycosyltransferase [Tildeniella torsiva UHER 1998/13D]|jgi:glycosyltransferase involved in cell wall biosynthesis|nr:glycosyltransferase [Tildeniella torsiva UHER 1998/13D]